ncbi:MAG TPA: metallophosphoesterase [Actinomycetota bacterium]|nr:metallophosphoesterase [Actinomycetota bacterium]
MKLRTIALPVLGLAAYSLWEARAYRLVVHEVPVKAGVPPLSVLHISDTHLIAANRKLRGWLERLPDALGVTPDLVVTTGDMIDHDNGIDPLIKSLEGLQGRMGRYYVLGSHDYYQSTIRGLVKGMIRLYGEGGEPVTARFNDTARLEAELAASGWVSLMNSTEFVDTPEGRIRITGIADPFMKRHRTDHIARTPEDAAAIGLVHSPEVVAEWALAGYDLVLAGHTHGGQVCVPGWGAVVTNSSLPASMAAGLTRVGRTWLHVSPGLGTGRFAPIRLARPPEATLLKLRPS